MLAQSLRYTSMGLYPFCLSSAARLLVALFSMSYIETSAILVRLV